jgi:hypothetical protein
MGEKAEILEQLRLAEAWFDVDGDRTIPVDKNHGKWLFKTAADEIERLREQLKSYQHANTGITGRTY